MQKTVRGLSIGELIRFIRVQLGMSQSVLARRAGVPQSTISRVETGQWDVSLSTLQKILSAMSCELVVAPVIQGTIESIQHKQAKTQAQRRVAYLKGTMNLEQQILQEPKSKLWEE